MSKNMIGSGLLSLNIEPGRFLPGGWRSVLKQQKGGFGLTRDLFVKAWQDVHLHSFFPMIDFIH